LTSSTIHDSLCSSLETRDTPPEVIWRQSDGEYCVFSANQKLSVNSESIMRISSDQHGNNQVEMILGQNQDNHDFRFTNHMFKGTTCCFLGGG